MRMGPVDAFGQPSADIGPVETERTMVIKLLPCPFDRSGPAEYDGTQGISPKPVERPADRQCAFERIGIGGRPVTQSQDRLP